MELKQVYQPIEAEFKRVSAVLSTSLTSSKNKSILEINRFLLASGGKKLRPAMVILSAKASTGKTRRQGCDKSLIDLAAAIELIHRASLIHDDIIDHADLRHSKPTINRQWGQEVAIAAGDYLYAEAFRLIASCGNPDVLACIGTATKLMCEGELHQVCERDNIELLKQQYLLVVKQKTAALFAASCQAGAMLAHANPLQQNILMKYGLSFGMAFQIRDDYMDLVGSQEDLGKSPGTDFKMGELTLPLFNLLEESKNKDQIMSLIRQADKQEAFEELRKCFINSDAFLKTKAEINGYVRKAQKSIETLPQSSFKEGLFILADRFVI
ncbi:MAG: polyprenyl synthetase family protein [Candidatus Omnitrophica bacterium]|nr:polyprenyl synthetase family protein [Candidatus Omnitrophota bacterium]